MLICYLALLDSQEDKDKFTEVYETYRKTMFFVAKQILHDEDLAEDAVHNAFMRIIKNLHKINLKDHHKTMGFVVAIARNVALTALKEQSKEILVEDPLSGCKKVHASPENEVVAKDMAERLNAFLKQLNPEFQEIMELVFYQGLKMVEAARILNISAPLARKRMQRAKEELRELLRKEGMEYDEF